MDNERDYLDELSDVIARDDPKEAERWAVTKLVAQLTVARQERGLTQAQVAERMGLPQQRVAEIERRPWSVSFVRVFRYARAIGVEVGIVGEDRVAA